MPFERGEILFSKGFFDFMDIRKLQAVTLWYLTFDFQDENLKNVKNVYWHSNFMPCRQCEKCLLAQRNDFAGNKHILTKIYNLYNNIPAENAFSVKVKACGYWLLIKKLV